jgi:hypothetical protein
MRHVWYLLVVALVVAAPARAAVPDGFVGATLDGAAARLAPDRLANELDVMRDSGVETVRVAWSWSEIQPYASWDAVPSEHRDEYRDVAGLPLNVRRTDNLVAIAARRGVRVMPMTIGTPSWDARRFLVPNTPPRSVAPYARFMRALVTRYGTQGTFWREDPDLPRMPIRWWQLWNEPHLTQYWAAPRWASGYAALLRAAARSIHRTDRRAKVVLAGLTTDRLPLWDRLDELLAEGVGPEVDMVAAHVFTRRPRNVVRALARTRATMRAYGLGRTQIALTEWSWPSSAGSEEPDRRRSWETDERGQARRVAETLRRLGAERERLRLRTAIHYSWLSPDRGATWAAWAGLRRLEANGRIVSKPALAAFRRVARGL